MIDDELTRLLQMADRDAHRVVLDGAGLAARVRKTHRRQRVRRVALAAGLPVIALITAVQFGRLQNAPATPIAKVPIPATYPVVTLAEIQQLEAAAERHQQRARALMVGEVRAHEHNSLSAEERALLRSDPLAELRQQVDVVAYRMILRADALAIEMRPSDEAIEIYRNVLRQFPATYSAEVARQRLERTVNLPGESS